MSNSWKTAMAAMLRLRPFLPNSILYFICIIPLCCSQSIFPQNIETYYPSPLTFHVPTINNTSDNLSTISRRPPPPASHPPPQESVQLQLRPTSKIPTIIAVTVSTAAATLLLFLCLVFCIRRCILAKHREEQDNTSSQSRGGQALVSQKEFKRFNGNFNGFILEENGLDVIYWKNPARRKSKKNEEEEVGFVKEGRRKPERVQETPLLHGMSSTKIEAHDRSVSSSQALPWLPPPPPPAPLRKPPPPPPPKAVGDSGPSSAGNDQARLKPLHWDKVNTNVDHAMVWDKIDGGSFRFNGDLMEALFGYVSTNKKSPKQGGKNRQTKSTGPNNGGRAQISILDSRRSRNIAIILKSLNISRQELLDALKEGEGLNSDTLEKLVKITPNQEEQSQILEFDGDPLKLGDAESFIFHLLKAVPTAFTRLNAMLFRSNFKSELIRLRDFSQTLSVGCEELKRKGPFTKLLEATLKAGNRLNSGTTRGDAQAFNLNSLLKLSDVKRTDGKTTLLQFVVEEVIKSEGKKGFSNTNSKNLIAEKEREIEYTILGLSAVESLTSELFNVKKASTIDYETFVATCPNLLTQISEIRKLLSKEGDEYKRKMMDFVKAAEEELETASREQKRVLEVVKKTNEYYETGDRENPLELFVIVRDFVGMVNQVCSEIGRNLRGKSKMGNMDACQPLKSSMSLRFPCRAEQFMCRTFSSDSADDSF